VTRSGISFVVQRSSLQSLGLDPGKATLAVHELAFILTKSRRMVDHISPGPITPEHSGIPAAPPLAPFNFAAV